ncbi:hypothetical protein CLAFUW4_13563 [Fulvia fulva]|uniref:Uncharacterized protein n=1 Tax=Passalora fulva TaxID=5499 RepID=A0A9Q8UW30_PASFU|nr:uncharacterized protein CLAFUR5_13414 [Fulvia fulva]KAK4610424.1 hypothetical protein CLAFUR4_13565 [Fulvia fulva]KAK4611088.1 hypothetical protein CLAFUR0_13574 [Fulvia fulva]UJO24609.1 hypothetical protein CLAFUR5_13414 [Fulvia fulva]WPV22255.1 hypothetical protein CLAFUW4_13563 [Fulvia fulva]WPV37274.1 hypothetical protein CLAFUW7_13570 [Fulvia fulva]
MAAQCTSQRRHEWDRSPPRDLCMLPTDYGERCICKRCFHMLKRSLTGVSREPRAALALFTSGTKASLFLKLTLFLFSPNNADSRHPQTTAASHSQQSTTINAIRQTNTNTAIMRFLLKIMMALMAMITVSAALPAADNAASTLSTVITSNAADIFAVPSTNDTLLHATRDPPCNDDVATICTECMSCTAKDSGIAIEYFVHTGWEIDYDRCQRVLDCMNEDHFANSITHWHCEADCRSGTYLHFNSIFHQQGRINWCFDDTWPEIEGDRDAFNCPSH